MIEVAAAISLANSAFTALKTGIQRGKELKEMGDSLAKFWDANDQIAQAKIEHESKPYVTKVFGAESVEAEAMQITMAKHKAAQMEKELREFLIYTGEGDFYRDMLRERRKIKQRRLEQIRAAAQRKKDLIDITIVVVVAVVVIGTLVAAVSAVASV